MEHSTGERAFEQDEDDFESPAIRCHLEHAFFVRPQNALEIEAALQEFLHLLDERFMFELDDTDGVGTSISLGDVEILHPREEMIVMRKPVAMSKLTQPLDVIAASASARTLSMLRADEPEGVHYFGTGIALDDQPSLTEASSP